MDRTAPTALTDGGLAALRRAAVMAHTVGAISLRLTAGTERIVDVVPDPERVTRPPAMARPSSATRVLDEVLRRMIAAVAVEEILS